MPHLVPESYFWVRPMFTSVYLLWAALWARVALYYGRASYASWLASGGQWRHAVSDVLSPFWWAIKATVCRLSLLRDKDFCAVGEVPNPYENGNLLRFAIFLGSLTPIAFGITFADLDRHDWTLARIVSTMLFASSSILAAGGHLFLAHRRRPEAWRCLVMNSVYWLILSYPFFALYYHLVPEGIPLI